MIVWQNNKKKKSQHRWTQQTKIISSVTIQKKNVLIHDKFIVCTKPGSCCLYCSFQAFLSLIVCHLARMPWPSFNCAICWSTRSDPSILTECLREAHFLSNVEHSNGDISLLTQEGNFHFLSFMGILTGESSTYFKIVYYSK